MPTLRAVRTNCHISDAQHAADYTLCVYLLKMREYYRWENNIPFNTSLPHPDLTDWLPRREAHWDTLEGRPFEKVPVRDSHFDPFDAETINNILNRLGHVYSSGYGRNMKPVFFLGALEQRREHEGYTVVVSGQEYARDLAAPPAMSIGKTIYIRRESLRRMLWEKIEEWRWNTPANAMQKALACYDFDSAPEQSLEAMTDTELQSVMLHEIGEVRAGAILGDEWEVLLAALSPSKAEIMVRAVRDHLADALSTLPALLQDPQPASLHFYMANMTNMRKELFPKLVSAYEIWTITGNTRELEQLVDRSALHWQALSMKILELFRSQHPECRQALVAAIEEDTL